MSHCFLLVRAVICDTKKIVQENHTYFLKRYLLNESKNKDLLVISRDGLEIAQYKSDPNRYEYNGRLFESENYENTYRECSPLTSLTFEDNELSLKERKELLSFFKDNDVIDYPDYEEAAIDDEDEDVVEDEEEYEY